MAIWRWTMQTFVKTPKQVVAKKAHQNSFYTKRQNKKNVQKNVVFCDFLRIKRLKNTNFVNFLPKYLNYKKQKVQQITYDNYCFDCKLIRQFFLAHNKKLGEICAQDVYNFAEFLKQKKYKSTTSSHYFFTLLDILNYAVFCGVFSSGTFKNIHPPKTQKTTQKYLTQAQLALLCNSLTNSQNVYAVPIVLVATYGLRKSEVLGLKWSSIDFDKNKISINHKVITSSKGKKSVTYCSGTLKTFSSKRTLPLLPHLKQMLLRHKKAIQYMCQKHPFRYCKKYLDFVCVNNFGVAYRGNTLYKNFKKILKTLGLPNIRLHDLRHSCASLLCAKGVSIKIAQEWLGHAHYQTTANIYTHLYDDAKAKTAQVVWNELFA